MKLLRGLRGLTQEDLAERAGTSAETISRIENGGAAPGLVMLDALARSLGVRIGDLTDGDEPISVAQVPLSNSELALLGSWRRLHATRQGLVLELLSALAARPPGAGDD